MSHVYIAKVVHENVLEPGEDVESFVTLPALSHFLGQTLISSSCSITLIPVYNEHGLTDIGLQADGFSLVFDPK